DTVDPLLGDLVGADISCHGGLTAAARERPTGEQDQRDNRDKATNTLHGRHSLIPPQPPPPRGAARRPASPTANGTNGRWTRPRGSRCAGRRGPCRGTSSGCVTTSPRRT